MKLNTLVAQPGARKTSKRLGRGTGSGLGKTSGKGHKGQRARSGVAIKSNANTFEGGQMPIIRRLPKRGFNSINRVEFNIINLGELSGFIAAGKLDQAKITKETLIELGIVKKYHLPLKLLAKGEFNYSTTIEVDFASARAIEIVSKNGGKVILSSDEQAV